MKLFAWVLLFAGIAQSVLQAEGIDLKPFVAKADAIVLYSLTPENGYNTDEHGNWTEEEKRRESLHGYPVLGKIVASDPKTKEKIRSAVLAALTPPVPQGGSGDQFRAPNQCFIPRHGVCLRQGDQHVDLLICFECEQARAIYWLDVEKRDDYVFIGPGGLEELNALLDAQKIKRVLPTPAVPMMPHGPVHEAPQ